jgi:glycosyltransferase involved in cell wall biosynthesis
MNHVAACRQAAGEPSSGDTDASGVRRVASDPEQQRHAGVGDVRGKCDRGLISCEPFGMPTNPLRVSVIIPVFNGARYLREAIGSVLDQTHQPADVTVVDDGSTDDPASVASSFGPRVVLIRQQNLGQPAAMNTGLARTTGDYVAFIDADDLWEPTKLARQLARLQAHPDAAYSVTRVRNFLSPELEDQRDRLDPSLFHDAPGYIASTLVARRDLFGHIGGFDDTLRHANKTAWFLRAREEGVRCEALDEVLVHRRLHGENLSQQAAPLSLDEYLHLVKRSLDRGRRART